jgi:Protein of unknown function (DUF3892)
VTRQGGRAARPERRRIECVTLEASSGYEVRIGSVGGAEGGAEWTMSGKEAIEAIDRGEISFYVIIGGTAREVIVGVHQDTRYLKTDADHGVPHHLLALPRCPDGAVADG